MSTNDTQSNESIDIEPRDARALTECMSVIPEGGDVYTVVGENGSTYSVDAREGRCTCPDAQYNLPTDGRETCKHVARVTYADGMRPVPGWVDRDAVDAHLGEHTDSAPRVALTDGGIIEADDDAERLDQGDGRPDECDCGDWNADADLPCWPCYRDGFGTPAAGEGE